MSEEVTFTSQSSLMRMLEASFDMYTLIRKLCNDGVLQGAYLAKAEGIIDYINNPMEAEHE